MGDSRRVRVPCLGRAPRGATAWVEGGRLHLQSARGNHGTALQRGVVVAPPRWHGRIVEVCCVHDDGASALHRVSLDGTEERIKLPCRTIDAVTIDGGWGIVRADPATGHVRQMGWVDARGRLRAQRDLALGWRVGGERSGRGVVWVFSHQGRRVICHQETAGRIRVVPANWPTSAWERRRFRVGGWPEVPAWVRTVPLPTAVWVALHGGPGIAWDAGPPLWLDLAVGPGNALVLLESPGAVGYGGRLLRWGYDAGRFAGFSHVLRVAFDALQRRWPQVPLHLAGESDGAEVAFEHLASKERARWATATLINGEYDPMRISSRGLRTPVLFVVGRLDDVVDTRSVARTMAQLRIRGTHAVRLDVDEPHRWLRRSTSRTVGAACRRFTDSWPTAS